MTQPFSENQGKVARGPLPITRRSETHQVTIGNREIIIVTGFYEDGHPGEIYITLAGNSPVEVGMTNVVSALISHLLQQGVAVGEITNLLHGIRFEPSGKTSNPMIPFCSSIIDYTGCYLEQRWGSEDQQSPLTPIIDISPLCLDCNNLMRWGEGSLICRACGYIRP